MENLQQSEFNMAVSWLGRLDLLFYQCDNAAMKLDITEWYHTLVALFRELSTEMKDEEVEKYKKTIVRLNNDVSQVNHYRGKIPPSLYLELHDFELFIRSILKRSGLQNRVMDDAMKALR